MGLLTEDFGRVLVRQPEGLPWACTPWGEEARVLVSPSHSGQPFCLMDYRAPSHFGPPRHIHFRDDETLRIVSGRIVVWSQSSCSIAGPHDVVVLPKGIAHTWRSLEEEVQMEVITAPGDLEVFFQRLQDRKATLENVSLLNEISSEIFVENIGPRLDEKDVHLILNGGQPV